MSSGYFVSKNSTKAYLRDRGMRISSGLVAQLDGKVRELLEVAVKRADGNGRSTVMAQDL